MNLFDDIIKNVPDNAIVRDFNTYLYGTLAQSLRTGYSAAVRDYQYPVNVPKRKSPDVEHMVGRPVGEALQRLWTLDHPVADSIATALVDASMPIPVNFSVGKAPQVFMDYASHKKLAFIGHFPYAEKLRDQGYDISIIEIDPGPDDISWNKSHKTLEECEMVFITGFSFVNRTLEEVINRTPNSIRVLLGASVPFANIFFRHGIHAICSIRIIDSDRLHRHYRHGGRDIVHLPDSVSEPVVAVRDDKKFILNTSK